MASYIQHGSPHSLRRTGPIGDNGFIYRRYVPRIRAPLEREPILLTLSVVATFLAILALDDEAVPRIGCICAFDLPLDTIDTDVGTTSRIEKWDQ